MSPNPRRLWMACHGLLAGLSVFLFDALILRRYGEQPVILAGWLLLAWALVFVLRELAAGTDPSRRSGWQRAWAGLDGADLALIAFFFALVVVFATGHLRATADGREYFVQVRSLVIDGDLSFAHENRVFRSAQPQTFPFGTAVLWAPFFLAAHVWLGLLNLAGAAYPRDGFANPYQIAVGLGTLVYGCAGLALAYRLARDFFAARVAALATMLVTGGSFLIWYLAVESSYSHGTSMFATTLFVFVWHRTRGARDARPDGGDDRRSGDGRTTQRTQRTRDTRQWMALGIAGGLMTMVRWQNAVFLVFALVDGVEEAARAAGAGSARREAWRSVVGHGGAFAAAFALAVFPQLVFWKVVNGGWLTLPPSQTGEHWWGSPLIAEVLFSADHGLFAWHPILFLALLGVPLLLVRDPRFGGLLALAFAAQVYVNGAVAMWWGGHAFGARRFASCTLLFVLGLAALLAWAQRRPLVAVSAVLITLVAVNGFFIADIRAGRLPTGQGIGFDRMIATTYERLGNPFSLPASLPFARRWGISPWQYDRLGLRTFNNLHLDMGSGNEEPYLGRGWSGPESGGGNTFRWAVGRESIVVAPLKSLGVDPGQAPYHVVLRAEPFGVDGAPDQTLELWVNDGLAGRQLLAGAMREYTIEVPAALLTRHLNVFQLRYAYAGEPAGADARRLAVRFEHIDFIRQPH